MVQGFRLKFTVFSVVLIALFIAFAGSLPAAFAAEEEGNSDGNLNQTGTIAEKGGWIYFDNYLKQVKLSKMKPDGTNATVLCNDSAEYINVIGDWIYYCTGRDTIINIYKIKTDGTHRTQMTSNGRSVIIKVIGNWIYYKSGNDNSTTIYRMKTDGSSKTPIISGNFRGIVASGGWVYYNNLTKNGCSLYKIKADGSNKTLLSKTPGAELAVDGEWVYFTVAPADKTGDWKLYRVKTDGTGLTKVSDDVCNSFNVYKGWIYYYYYNGYNKMRLDGSEKKTNIINNSMFHIQIAGDWIYYDPGSAVQRKARLDGSDDQYAVKRVPVSVPDIDATVLQNDAYSLQPVAKATLNDGHDREVAVNWGTTAADTSKTGKYIYEGSINDYSKKVKLTLNVIDEKSFFRDKYYGHVIEKDGWIYCAKLDYKIFDKDTYSYTGALYKRKTDDTEWVKLCDGTPTDIILVDDWIYFERYGREAICRIKTDGTGLTRLNDEDSSIVRIMDGFIYYINGKDSYRLYKMKTDGTAKSRVSDKVLYAPVIANGWIYYQDYPNLNIFKMKLDGTANTKICSDSAYDIHVIGDWIYYNSKITVSGKKVIGNGGINKIKTDGTQKALIRGEWGNFFEVAREWIYFCDPGSFSLYKIRADGTGETKLNSDKTSDINIIGDWIYYKNESDGFKVYKVRTDGKERQLVW